MKKVYIYFHLILLIPVILLLLLTRIFKNFKINKIISHKIGHLATPMEIYICEKKEYPNKPTIIWFFDKRIANKFLKKQWSRKLMIFPRHILEPIYILFKKYEFFNFFFEDFNEESELVKRTLKDGVKQIDDKNVLSKHKPSIVFNNEEIKEGENYLKKIGFENKKIFTFSARTSNFHSEKIKSNRNSNINNQNYAIKFLVSKDYSALRIGKNEKEKIKFNNENIIDYAISEHRSDFLDVYLASKSDFMISSESGINELAVMFRKPVLIIDHYYCGAYEKYASKMIILPKKFKNIDTGNLVSYDEAYKKLMHHDNPLEIIKLGYEVIDNSEFEVKQAAESMLDLLNNNFTIHKILKKQKIFWSQLENSLGYQINKNVIICPRFYSSNISLFEN